MELLVTKSKRGKELLVYKNYTYYLNKRIDKTGKSFWRCSINKNCNGRITLGPDERTIYSKNLEHNHRPVYTDEKNINI